MSHLVNRGELKRYLIDRASVLRPALGLQRVSDSAVQSLESRLRNLADDLIRRQPCIGRTIKP
jgi:hypothetical protein